MTRQFAARPSRHRREAHAHAVVTRLSREVDAPVSVWETLHVAVERGNVRDPADYLQRIIRFQRTGEWIITRLDGVEASPQDVFPNYVGGGRAIPASGGRVTRTARYE